MEECIAEGITITMTVSFTVPQAVAIGRAAHGRHPARPSQRHRARKVLRRDHDRPSGRFPAGGGPRHAAAASESDIRQAGLAATKRAYPNLKERGYKAVLLVAALRGDYHLTELAGADLVMSIAPAFQESFVTQGPAA